jgi:hypothetical protein
VEKSKLSGKKQNLSKVKSVAAGYIGHILAHQVDTNKKSILEVPKMDFFLSS